MRAAYITAFSKTLENLRVEAVPDPIVQRGESKIKICSTGGSLVLPGEEPHHRLEGHSSICGLRPRTHGVTEGECLLTIHSGDLEVSIPATASVEI